MPRGTILGITGVRRPGVHRPGDLEAITFEVRDVIDTMPAEELTT